jgi:hypothetical protein
MGVETKITLGIFLRIFSGVFFWMYVGILRVILVIQQSSLSPSQNKLKKSQKNPPKILNKTTKTRKIKSQKKPRKKP